jgi:hypothetical protein
LSTKFIRFVAVLAILVSIAGNTGVGRADRGAPPSFSAQNLESLRAPELNPLTIPPASSLGVQFVHVATAANSDAHTTLIDNPLTNLNPNAIILVTPNWKPGGVLVTFDQHHIGVFYNSIRGQWGIYNEDGVNMPVGAVFNVIIPTAGVFVHTVTGVNNYTTFNNVLTHGKPNAIVFVTPNYNPGNVGGTNANFPIGVFYDNILSDWGILNQDLTVIPANAAFNVFVLTAGAGVFVHTATVSNIANNHTYIDNVLTNGHPNAIVFVTPNFNRGEILDKYPIAVYFNGSKWEIYNQDVAAMPTGTSFNVLVLVPAFDIFVHTFTTANTYAGYGTNIDSPLTNGHPNAILLVTQNYNPGNVGGSSDDHPIGVLCTSGKWVIFNQDFVAMPLGASFNVLVPNPDTSVFVHKATAANILLHSTIIDYPLTNSNPNAIIFVTQNFDPGNVGENVGDNRPIGVFYDGSKWRIYNEDGSAMPVGAAFNVFVPTAGPGVGVFVTKFTGPMWPVVTIDNPLANGNPNAIILVTPNYNPGGVGGVNANFPIGVRYYSTSKKWGIFSQDGTNMINTTAFNIYVVPNYKIYLPLVIR